MARRWWILVALGTGGCGLLGGGRSDTIDEDDDDAPDDVVAAINYEPFDIVTRSEGVDGSRHQISLSSEPGSIACQLSLDPDLNPGMATSQVFISLRNTNGFVCHPESHPLDPDCPDTIVHYSQMPGMCMYFRKFDDDGEVIGVLPATAGAVVVSGDHEACTFDIEAVFDGETLRDTFTLRDGLTANPWCITE